MLLALPLFAIPLLGIPLMLPFALPIARAVNLRARSFGQRTKRVRFPSRRAVGDTVPSPPTNFLATDAGGGEYDLTWDAPITDGGDAVTDYNVYKNGVFLDTIAAPTEQLDGVAAVGGDTFYVKAVNGIGESAASSAETIPEDPGSGLFGSMWGAMLGRMWGRNQS